jgi:hypothetical protein
VLINVTFYTRNSILLLNIYTTKAVTATAQSTAYEAAYTAAPPLAADKARAAESTEQQCGDMAATNYGNHQPPYATNCGTNLPVITDCVAINYAAHLAMIRAIKGNQESQVAYNPAIQSIFRRLSVEKEPH